MGTQHPAPRTLCLMLLALLGVASDAQQRPPASEQQQQEQQQQPQQGQPPAGQQRPSFVGGVNFVRVDVIVSHKQCNPVADLQQGDFDAAQDVNPPKIDTFKLVQMDDALIEA